MILNVEFKELNVQLNPTFSEKIAIENVTDYPYYEGDYEVTPTLESKVLETKKRTLIDDVTIKGIPVYETSNLTGGTTIYIAKE